MALIYVPLVANWDDIPEENCTVKELRTYEVPDSEYHFLCTSFATELYNEKGLFLEEYETDDFEGDDLVVFMGLVERHKDKLPTLYKAGTLALNTQKYLTIAL